MLLLAPAAIAALQDASGARPPDEPGRGTLAVLRRDGVAIPFASVSGDNWSAYWPTNLRLGENPITLSAIPRQWWAGRRPQAWRLWDASGTTRAVAVSSLTTVQMPCGGRLAFRTDYQGVEPVPPQTYPYPKDGLLVGGGLKVEPVEQVPAESPDRAKLGVALLGAFDRAEEETVRRIRTASGWEHPVDSTARRAIPVRIEALYRAPLPEEGWSLSYVEALRAYPPRPEDDGCGLETLFNGWVYSRGEKLVERTDLLARITYCDRVGAMYMLPLGRIRPRRLSYWIYQMSGWDQEWYTVAQVSRRQVRYIVEFAAYSAVACGNRR